jgi:protein TonB
MKKIPALFICCAIFFSANAQTEKSFPPPPPPQNVVAINDSAANTSVFTKVEVEAQFPGGEMAWRNYLMKNLNVTNAEKDVKYPVGKNSFFVTIIVKFIVDKEGNISAAEAENKDADPSCIAEAIRVIKMSPKWIPARQNKRVVNAYRRQPISFSFQKQN